MPSVDSTVAQLAIPVPAGAADAPIDDPTVSGLLDYVAFWTKFVLDPKLATMTAPPVPDACPVGSRFPFNPSSLIVKMPRPALFAWWDGKSIIKPWTTIKDVRQRDITVMYVFDRVMQDIINTHTGLVRYRGLVGALDAAWARSISRRNHPTYQPPNTQAGGAPGFRPGTPIAIILGLNGIDYLGGQEGFLAEFSTASARQAATQPSITAKLQKGNANGILQGYPCLKGVFRVLEEIGPDTPEPSDLAADISFQARVSEQGGPPLALDERYFPSTDAIEDET